MRPSDRVDLRPLVPSDAADLYALDRDPDVLRHTSDQPLADPSAYGRWIADECEPIRRRDPAYGYLAIVARATGAFLGWACLHLAADAGPSGPHLGYEPEDVEVGYRLRRAAWGRGVATDVTTRLVASALARPEVPRVVAATSAANLASIRVLEKSGLARRPGVRHVPGVAAPFLVYALDRP